MLTNEQSSFAHHTLDKDIHAKAIAAPGAGKTTALIARVKNLLEKGVRPSRILIVAFNKAISSEIGSVIKSLRRFDDLMEEEVEIRTLNSFGVRLSYYLYEKTGHKSLVTSDFPASSLDIGRFINGVISGSQSNKVFIKTGIKDSPVYLMIGDFAAWLSSNGDLQEAFTHYLSESKELGLETYRIAELLSDILNGYRTRIGVLQDMLDFKAPHLTTVQWKSLLQLAKIFDSWLKSSGVTTFADQIYRPAMLLASSAKARACLVGKWDYVLADEYQDFTEAAHSIITTICRSGTQLNAVGDPRQSIYEFAGSDPQLLMTGLNNTLGVVQEYRLTQSFRFGSKLANLANHVAAPLMQELTRSDDEFGLDFMEEDISTNSDITGVGGPTKIDRSRSSKDVVALLRNSLAQNKRVAVVCRYHEQKTEVEKVLREGTVPFLSDRQERDVGQLLYNSIVFAVRTWARRAVEPDLAPSFWLSAEGERVNPALLKEAFSGQSDEGFMACYQGLCITSKLKNMMRPQTAALISVEMDQLAAKVAGWVPSEAGMDNASVDQVLTDLKQEISDRKEHAGDERDSIQGPMVELVVAHASKGLEYDVVCLWGCNDGVYPYSRPGEAQVNGVPVSLLDDRYLMQERRLFFVAATRARQHLIMYIAPGAPVTRYLG